MKQLALLQIALLLLATSGFSQTLWTQKTTCPSNSSSTVSFTIQSVGYLYTGTATNNFYAYDPVANTWTAKASFPGAARSYAAGFAIDSFGYIGTGLAGSTGTGALHDFYKYDPVANAWSAIANYPDTGVYAAFSFCLNNFGYVTGGISDTVGVYAKGYAYNPSTNTWSPISPMPHATSNGFSAVLNSKAYCGFGNLDSIYVYDPSLSSWAKLAPDSGVAFSYDFYSFVQYNKIYVLDRNADSSRAGLRVYDPVANSWSLINIYPYPRGTCNNYTPFMGMTIGGKGYIGGSDGCNNNGFWQYDTSSYYINISSFSPDSICPNDSFSVSLSSNLTFGSGNSFKILVRVNNGGSTSLVSDSVAATSSGTYTFRLPTNYNYPNTINSASISVLSTSPTAQSQYPDQNLYIKKGPVELTLPDSFKSCGGSAVLLYRSNTYSQISVWNSNPPGVNDTTSTLSFTPTATTDLYVTDIYTLSGCSVLDSSRVILYAHPALNITDSSFSICAGTTATLGGTPTPDCSYSWTGGTTSSSPNPVVSPASNSTYHVLVKDSNSGCSVSGNTTVAVKFAPAQTICFVTVDSASTHNVVIWEKLDRDATDSFFIYRETSTNIYTQIASIPADSLSQYDDYGANPNVTAFRYKIGVKDTCNNIDTLSPYHNTIHLQYLGSGNLIWNVYEIENASSTPVLSFDVYIDSLANGNWSILINVPGNQYTATDINYSMHPSARYRISANWAYSCTPTRSSNSAVLSNFIQISPSGIASVGSDQRLNLYPNPAHNELMISSPSLVQQVSIIDAEGQIVSTTINPINNRVNISQLADGIYIAEIKVNDTIQRIRWTKM